MTECKNWRCRKDFEPTHHAQKYCSKECAKRGRMDSYIVATKKYREKTKRELTPEQKKRRTYQNVAQRYKKGKLPKWMYS